MGGSVSGAALITQWPKHLSAVTPGIRVVGGHLGRHSQAVKRIEWGREKQALGDQARRVPSVTGMCHVGIFVSISQKTPRLRN